MIYFNKGAAVGECPKHGQRCRPRVAGYSWTQISPDSWKRFLLRVCVQCGDKNAQHIHWINPAIPFCTKCFSQDIAMLPDLVGVFHLSCANCKEFHGIMTREQVDGGSGI